MKHKIRLVITIFTLLSLSVSATVYAGEENRSVPLKVQDIANGSDDIFGEGVPLDHTENPNARFQSGGIDHTHQYILANALIILNNDKGESIFDKATNAAALLEATDWPDKLGNETDIGTFSGHFYDPDTGKNWIGQSDPTARTRAEKYFSSAVIVYKNGNIDQALNYLGKGTHYVSDLNEPHHASNLTAINSNHSAFEKYVDENRKLYNIDGNTFDASVYDKAVSSDMGNMMYSAAKAAKMLADEAQNENTYTNAGNQSVQHAIQSVTQYIYKFGKEVGIY